ncbi:ABC transporter ATP-binding protein [Pelagibius sp. CAU 1746]|uniref:ABC transporter ATP-binding protein n=1 Tax=Pelagibius sp. CAU 1746 TaxID=3140370 RepID=UPI00325BEB30
MSDSEMRNGSGQASPDQIGSGRIRRGEEVLSVTGLRTQFGPAVIHDNLDFSVRAGEVMGVVGGSGTGKSVLIRTIIGLNKPRAGRIVLFGQDVAALSPREWRAMQSRWGVLFQDGALFSSLTVAQNIEVPMKEHSDLPPALRRELIEVKIAMVGLPPDAAHKFPAELSGGMRKRAGLARALALDADILFLDEPTAGLDPIGAANFDGLIGDLQRALGLTVVMVTHDLDSLYAICDRVSVLVDKRVKVGTIEELMREPDPWIQEYFGGPRGRAAATSAGQGEGHAGGHAAPEHGV